MQTKTRLLLCLSLLLPVFALYGDIFIKTPGVQTRSMAYADSPDIAIYTDQLMPTFVNWSWNSGVSFQDTGHPSTGTAAIAFTPSAWGALYLHTDTSIPVTNSESLEFSLMRTNDTQRFAVALYDETDQQITSFLPLTTFSPLGAPNSYQTYTLPLSTLNPTGKPLKGIAFQEISGQNQSAIFIDDIFLKAKLLPTATPVPSATTTQPTITSTPSAGTSAYPIFTDILATGVTSWSWGSTTIFNNTSPVFSGTNSISYTVNQGWAGLFLHLANPVDTTDYSSFTFTLQASAPSQNYSLVLRDETNANIGNPVALTNIGGDLPSGSWKTYTVPLSTLNSSNKKVSGFVLQDTTGHSQPVVYLDEIKFLTSSLPAQPSVSSPTTNPFAGASFYVDQNSSAKRTADSWRQAGRVTDADQLMKIASQPTALWAATANPFTQVNSYLTKTTATNSIGLLVAYNLPGRDCGLYSQGGSTYTGYQAWINKLSDTIGSRNTAVILEPDSLGLDCLQNENSYSLLKYAVDTLTSKANISVYVDASSWVSADIMSQRLNNIDISRAQGVALNTSGFNTTDSMIQYGQLLSSKVGGKHFIIDTSRNGNGPYDQTQPEPWCNPPGRALGNKPTSATNVNNLDAYLWVKIPGESDGSCRGGPSAGTWWADYSLGLAKQTAY